MEGQFPVLPGKGWTGAVLHHARDRLRPFLTQKRGKDVRRKKKDAVKGFPDLEEGQAPC